MANDYDNRGSGSNTTLIIVGIVGGVFLVFLLVCGGLGYLAIRAMRDTMGPLMEGMEQMGQSQVVVNDFLEHIRANQLDLAYQMTSESYQKRTSRQAFDELVQKHPELKEPGIFPMMDVNQNAAQPQTQPFAGPYRYRYTVPAKDGKEPLEFKITVSKEKNGELKVDQLTLYKEEKPKKEENSKKPEEKRGP